MRFMFVNDNLVTTQHKFAILTISYQTLWESLVRRVLWFYHSISYANMKHSANTENPARTIYIILFFL